MPRLLRNDYSSVLEVETKGDLERHVVRFTQALGFRTVTAIIVIDHSHRESDFFWIDNGSPEFQQISGDPDRAKRDPVMQHCKYKNVPIVWDQGTYVAAGQADKWEEQARFGYRCGIAPTEGSAFLLGCRS
jgi:hypothetical protein